MQIAMHHLCLFSERQSTYILNPVHISLTFIFLKKKNYLFERERSHKQGDGSGAKGESDSPLSREPDVGLNQSQMLNRLSHPGAHPAFILTDYNIYTLVSSPIYLIYVFKDTMTSGITPLL